MMSSAVPASMVAAICCVLGLVVGSFLNVVIYRVPRGISLLRPPSSCPGCGSPVRPMHNVPVVSWLMLRGRCADCRTAISVRYPLVEAGTATAFAVLGGAFAHSAALPALLYLAGAGIALAVVDMDLHRLPTVIVGTSFAAVFGFLVAASASTGEWGALGRGLGGAVASYAFFRVIIHVWPGGMGGGDMKLAALLGLMSAWLGWDVLVVGLFVGFLLGASAGLGLMARGRATRRTALPFGPFLIAGAFVGVFFGPALSGAYVSVLTGGSA